MCNLRQFLMRSSLVAVFLLSGVSLGAEPDGAPVIGLTGQYSTDIRPIFIKKCIACHACYDAPCQLKLDTPEGLLRGRTEVAVYDGARLDAIAPSRLFTDALTEQAWRQRGFSSVLSGAKQEGSASSLLYRMLKLRRDNPFIANHRIPDAIELGVGRENLCPQPDQFEDYAAKRPKQGMPLGLPALSTAEMATVKAWLDDGAVTDMVEPELSAQERAAILRWETFLNGPGKRQALLSRYLFEHLFIADLHFTESGSQQFFSLIRSSDRPGQKAHPVATVRPNDPVEGAFYYRLVVNKESLVHKTRITYALNPAKLARIRDLFLSLPWAPESLPDYSEQAASNPFLTFAALPASARYRFMLDDAEYFIRTFIRGPVCRGQVATGVIRDRFWTLFLDPEQDAYLTNKAYRQQVSPLLGLPAANHDFLAAGKAWLNYFDNRNRYTRSRSEFYRQHRPQGFALADIWHGDSGAANINNRSALLTVFRHHDSASVVQGFQGDYPQTMWVMDFPLLERTYYELVVNFNVFGSVAHQAQTRLYFDLIRNEGEHNLLAFLPARYRAPLLKSWYQDGGQLKLKLVYAELDKQAPSQVKIEGDSPVREFARQVRASLGVAAGPNDRLNRCQNKACYPATFDPTQRQVEQALRQLSLWPARVLPVINWLPEVSFVHVVASNGRRSVYTLIRDRAHSNVAFMFGESLRLQPEKDRITVMPGTVGSYPNFIFTVPEAEAGAFVAALQGVSLQADFNAVVRRWGLRRTRDDFWDIFHDITAIQRAEDPIQAGIFDLNRYLNL